MINPNNVNLLIFDMDGTILSSIKPVFEAIKRAFTKLNWKIQISQEEMEKYFGVSSDDFYKNIIPTDKRSLWPELRSKAREEYDSCLREFASVFPGVIETLEILGKRGYKLALCSNSGVRYFNSAISILKIRDYFDYAECVQENNLTKIELVQKIKDKFSSSGVAVIGDRIHDIEAARENNALSVGALYGYGGKELEPADITINRFSELLVIFDRRLPIFEKILAEVRKRKQKDKAFVVGISGIDVSGKTEFAASFEKFLISKNCRTQLISLDDFHNPRKVRYSGEDQAENYYQRGFDIKTIVEKLLIPVQRRGNFSVRLTLLDLLTDEYKRKKQFSFNQDTIVLFEGVFLFREEFSPHIDYKIFIEVPFEESKNRARVRDIPIYGAEVLERYDEKYLPAQRKYLDEYPPSKVADMIIDNSDWECPREIYRR